jgi:hypothetical protein
MNWNIEIVISEHIEEADYKANNSLISGYSKSGRRIICKGAAGMAAMYDTACDPVTSGL